MKYIDTIVILLTIAIMGFILHTSLSQAPSNGVGAYVGATLDRQVDTSDAAALNDGENWTTGWLDRTGYSALKVAFTTDQNGYYTIQYSPDGVNADSTLTRYYRTNQIEPPHKFENMRRYVKVTFYNNSGSNQTYLRPDISFSNSAAKLNIPNDATMSQDYDAIATRPSDITYECALGRRQNCSTWNKFGYNDDIDTGTEEVLASFGGTFQYITKGEKINIVSSDTQDNSSGPGLRTAVLYGVGGTASTSWNPVIETVSMNGTTAVQTSNFFIGINRMTIFQSGASSSNIGNITATASTSGYTMAVMPAAQGTTQQCMYYVPESHTFLATWLWLNGQKSGPASDPEFTFKGKVYSDVVASEFEVFRVTEDTALSEFVDITPVEPFVIGEKSILWFTGVTSANNSVARCRFSGKLFKDVDA